MAQLTVTAKGQITLRRDILSHLGVRQGDQLTIDKLPNGKIEVSAAPRPGTISDVFNMFDGRNVGLSIDDINAAAAEGWAGGE